MFNWFAVNQQTTTQDSSSCVRELDAYLADCNINNLLLAVLA